MSTRGTLCYLNYCSGKPYNKHGTRNEHGIHIYHECVDNTIHLEVRIIGIDVLNIDITYLFNKIYGTKYGRKAG